MIKWLFRRLVLASGGPVWFFCNLKLLFKRNEDISNEFLEPFWKPWTRVSPTAILNEEKALGTRLAYDWLFTVTKLGTGNRRFLL